MIWSSRYEDLVLPSDKIDQRLLEAKRVANGRSVVERIDSGGLIYYDVLDPATGKVVLKQQ